VDVRSDRTYRFDRPAAEVWRAFAQVDAYRDWWPWLHDFDADALVTGDRWQCTVRPPLPYVLRFTITIDTAVEPERIDATVSGDLRGDASVELRDDGDGCAVRLRSTLRPAGRPLRIVATLAPWLARQGHDWVLDTGSRQFRRKAL
jgi:uncharacterized protein YndB with AHSA1/START domain